MERSDNRHTNSRRMRRKNWVRFSSTFNGKAKTNMNDLRTRVSSTQEYHSYIRTCITSLAFFSASTIDECCRNCTTDAHHCSDTGNITHAIGTNEAEQIRITFRVVEKSRRWRTAIKYGMLVEQLDKSDSRETMLQGDTKQHTVLC